MSRQDSREGDDEQSRTTAEARYRYLERERQPYLDEARRCAALTVPWVCPPARFRTNRVHLAKPNQGLGARGVSNLVGKFLTVLMPPGMPFFKQGLAPKVEADLKERGEALSTVQLALSKHEMDFVDAVAQDGDRAGIASGFIHLPITGQVLLHALEEGGMRFFGIDQYVVRFAADGRMLETLLCEATPFDALDEEHQDQLSTEVDLRNSNDLIEVFTWVWWDADEGRYKERQEARGMVLNGTEADWPKDACPWIPLRWSYVAGENYARGLIEAIYKDMERYDHLCKAIGDASKNAAKLLWMVNGGGGAALARKLSDAENGDFIVGDRKSVEALQQDKANDLQISMKEKQDLQTGLSLIFLIGTSIQRGGDRVTKFEVEYMARELEAVYSNEYTIIGRDFQERYYHVKSAQLRRRGIIPALPQKALKVQITTGIDALGRGSDQQRLESLADLAVKAVQLPPDMISKREFLRRSAANLAVKPDGLIPSEEEAQAMMQQQQQQETMQGVMPEIVKGLGESARQQRELQATSPSTPTGEPTPQ